MIILPILTTSEWNCWNYLVVAGRTPFWRPSRRKTRTLRCWSCRPPAAATGKSGSSRPRRTSWSPSSKNRYGGGQAPSPYPGSFPYPRAQALFPTLVSRLFSPTLVPRLFSLPSCPGSFPHPRAQALSPSLVPRLSSVRQSSRTPLFQMQSIPLHFSVQIFSYAMVNSQTRVT